MNKEEVIDLLIEFIDYRIAQLNSDSDNELIRKSELVALKRELNSFKAALKEV